MPLATSDLIIPQPTTEAIGFSLEPAHNIHHSLVTLARADEVSGFDDWVYRTAAAMTPEERETHSLVMIGFYYATRPDAGYPSFPFYLEHLATMSPLALRDKVLDAYIDIVMKSEGNEAGGRPSKDEILTDVNRFIGFLRQGFSEEAVIPEIERRAYTYLIDPPAMQALIVGHLRAMWYKYLAVEWERVRPMLQKSVRAFEGLDFSELSRMKIAERVVGRPLTADCWPSMLEEAERITFVPSAHIGPYHAKAQADGHLWFLFGARLPEGADEDVPELSRAELLVRLSALADDTRLGILKSVADAGELRSQDIMARLDLSQSGTSRHLQQLTAAGFLSERRCNGAKCYHLNSERVDNTLQALGSYLTGANARELVSPGWARGG